jgi:muramidase (phage lysozyme)
MYLNSRNCPNRVGIRNSTDYSPFGVELDGRTVSLDGYRFGFQNQEKDDEIKGEGNSINYTFRMHDPRLGRFFAVDPLAKSFPHNSAFAFSENRVIDCGELEGLQIFYAADGTRIGQFGTSTQVRVVQNKDVEAFKKEFYRALYSHNEFVRIKTNIENNAYSSGLSNAKNVMYNHSKISIHFQDKVMKKMSRSIGMTEQELNLRAFLTTIRQAENSSNEHISKTPLGYNVNYGGGTFDDYTNHPHHFVTKYGFTSDAAGAYQFLGERWNTISKELNLPDFSPKSQDKGALYLIREQNSDNPRANGVIDDINSGRITQASIKLNGTWTSLPGGKQTKMTTSQFMNEFKGNLKNELNGKSEIDTEKGMLKL